MAHLSLVYGKLEQLKLKRESLNWQIEILEEIVNEIDAAKRADFDATMEHMLPQPRR